MGQSTYRHHSKVVQVKGTILLELALKIIIVTDNETFISWKGCAPHTANGVYSRLMLNNCFLELEPFCVSTKPDTFPVPWTIYLALRLSPLVICTQSEN